MLASNSSHFTPRETAGSQIPIVRPTSSQRRQQKHPEYSMLLSSQLLLWPNFHTMNIKCECNLTPTLLHVMDFWIARHKFQEQHSCAVYLNLDATKKLSVSQRGFLLQSHYMIRKSVCGLFSKKLQYCLHTWLSFFPYMHIFDGWLGITAYKSIF